MLPTGHPSFPSVQQQSSESPTSPCDSHYAFHSISRPTRLMTRLVHVTLRPTRSSGTHWVISPSCAPHRASLSLSFLLSDKRPLPFVECFICFLVHLPFILCFLFMYGPGQPLPFVMDTVDSFPLMTICRYTLPLCLIVSEHHPLSWHCALHQTDLICHLPFMPSLGLVTFLPVYILPCTL
jgi:hypothetical protein